MLVARIEMGPPAAARAVQFGEAEQDFSIFAAGPVAMRPF